MAVILGKRYKYRLSGLNSGETYKVMTANVTEDTCTIQVEKEFEGVLWHRNKSEKYSELKARFESNQFQYCE